MVPLVILATLMVEQTLENVRSVSEHRLVQATKEMTNFVDQEIQSTIRILNAVAQSQSLQNRDLRAFHKELQLITEIEQHWITIILIDLNGKQLINSARPWGSVLPLSVEKDSLISATQTGEIAVGSLTEDPNGRLGIPVRIPIIFGQKLFYILTAVLSPNAFQDMLTPYLANANEWTRTIIDQKGIILARSRNPKDFVGKKGTSSFLEFVDSRDEGVTKKLAVDGEEIYISFKRILRSRWIVAIGVPVYIIETTAWRSVGLVAVIGLLLLLIFGGLAFWYSQSLARSISAIATGARLLARGKLPKLNPSHVKEVADLSLVLVEVGTLLKSREAERNALIEKAEEACLEAEAANEAKDKFLAMLGHELRNPLGAISNGTYLLRQLISDNDEVNKVQEIIERQVLHLTRLIDDLLDASRIARGKLDLNLQELDLCEVVREINTDFQHRFAEAGHQFYLNTPSCPLWIFGDKTRLAQCISNLLHNSLKFTPAPGVIVLDLKAEGKFVHLTVKDNGIGIEPKLMPSLFQDFVQGSQNPSRPVGGLGLGLSVVRSLVRMMGGHISAYSDGQNRGTTMTITLPLNEPKSQSVEETDKQIATHSKPKKILVVEDIDDLANSLEKSLALHQHKVKVSSSGKDALLAYREETPDIIICDIGLPDLNGNDLCRQLLNLKREPKPCMIAMSGYGQTADIERSIQAGFDHHLTKPINITKLLEIIENGAS